jgi:hypothetical protein
MSTGVPRDCAVVPAACPDGGTWNLLLRVRKMTETARRGRGATLELAHTVRAALQSPRAIGNDPRCPR